MYDVANHDSEWRLRWLFHQQRMEPPVWWFGQKQQNTGQGGCWRKQLFVDSSSGHLEAIFILEFLPMLLKHPLSYLKCLVLISSISYKVSFGGSVTDCSESDGCRAGTSCSTVTLCCYNDCVFLPQFLFFCGFFRVLLWAQNILFFLFYKEKLEHGEMKGQIVQKHLAIERFRWALNIIFRRTSTPYS